MSGLVSKMLVGALVVSMLFLAGVAYFTDLNEGYDVGIAQNLTLKNQTAEIVELTNQLAESTNQTSGDYTGLGYALLEGGIAAVKILPTSATITVSVVSTIFSEISRAVPIAGEYVAIVFAIIVLLVMLYVLAIIIGRQGGSL